jgi:hypothetical protein
MFELEITDVDVRRPTPSGGRPSGSQSRPLRLPGRELITL